MASTPSFSCCTRGQDVVPVEFIVARGGGKYLGAHQHSLVINAIAQAQALMLGRHGVSAHQRLPGQPAQQLFAAAAVQPGLGGGADRFVRAPRVQRRGDLGHQQL